MTRLSVVLTGTSFNALNEQAQNKAFTEGWRAAGDEWKDAMFERHFRKNAKRRYKHKPRNTGYKKQKLKASQGKIVLFRGGRKLGNAVDVEGGGITDNVFSGDSRRQLGQSRKVRAGKAGATITMKGPSEYWGITPGGNSNQPNKKAELTTVIPAEVKQMQDKAAKAATARIKKLIRKSRWHKKIG